jgi:hypothetical protein
LLQGNLEVFGVAADDDLVDIELMRSTDDLAVRELSMFVGTSGNVSSRLVASGM